MNCKDKEFEGTPACEGCTGCDDHKVLKFPPKEVKGYEKPAANAPITDVPQYLRDLADRMERGDLPGEYDSAIVLGIGPYGINNINTAPGLNSYEAVGMLRLATDVLSENIRAGKVPEEF